MLKLNVKKYVVIASAVMLIIFSHYAGFLDTIENFLIKKFNPALSFFYSLSSGINKTYMDQSSKMDLSGELMQAEEKINQLIAENARLRFLKEENAELRKSLNFLDGGNRRYLMSNIISRGGFMGNDGEAGQSAVIDKGSADGLLAGLAVVNSTVIGNSIQGIVVGKITDVKEHISEIHLATSKNIKFAASILGENKTSGIASGELGLTIKMDFIPQTENIRQGDIVATSGLEKNIPRGLAIGRIGKVIKENNEVWQSASVEPLVDLDSLSIVSVLLP